MQVHIWVQPSCFMPEFEMLISVPKDRDKEEYIDELLESLVAEEFRYNLEWGYK